MTAGTTILSAPSRLALRIMSDEDVARLHRAALQLLGDEGAAAAEEAAALAPASVVLAGRDREYDLLWDGSHSWLAAGGPAELLRPRAGGAPCVATGAELDQACRLADALPDVGLVVCPLVRTGDLTTLGELRCCLAATRKHVQLATLRSAAQAEHAVRMARAIASASASMATRPPISLFAESDGLAAGLVFARAGLPVGLVLDVDGGPRDAADLAGALVRHHAGVLAGCCAVQAQTPGAPFFYVVPGAREGLVTPGPEAVLFALGAMQLAAHVGLPVSVGALATGAGESDWQSCTDNAFGVLGALAAHGGMVLGAGSLSGGRVLSLQQLVMDAEIFSWSARIAAGVRVDQDTLALEAIKQVGIGGNYLGQGHTRQYMRQVWRPRLLDRSMWDAWVASGREGAFEKASSYVEQLLGAREGVPLDDVTNDALEDIVAEAGL
jgi:trimethylamine--corrinoid protein Co-methyltransferase